MDTETLEIVAIVALAVAVVSLLFSLVLAGKVSSLRRRVEATGLGVYGSSSTVQPMRSATSSGYQQAAPGVAGSAGFPVSDEVRALVAANRRIEAIKMLRTQTGLGLKEAKDVVDGL